MFAGDWELLTSPTHPPRPRPRPRASRRRARIVAFASGSAASNVSSTQAFTSSSDWENLPQDVLLSVVAQLQGSLIVPAVTTCKQWLGQLAEFVYQAKLSQLPISTPATDAARRKSPSLFLCALLFTHSQQPAIRLIGCQSSPNPMLGPS